MGCVLGRPSGSVSGSRHEVHSIRIESNRNEVNNVSLIKTETTESTIVVVAATSNVHEVATEAKRSKPEPRRSNPPKNLLGEQVAAGWPSWLSEVCGEALSGWIPRKANSFEKIEKIGSGIYSNVYKAKDLLTGNIVALKKVRCYVRDRESLRFMAREILTLRRLDHPNIIKLEGLVTSRMASGGLYLVFSYMHHDLLGLAASPDIRFTEQQVKCYMKQLLSGLEHCHNKGVLHRDIKGANLLIDDGGVLRICDFGLATFYDASKRQKMTNRVVALCYRAPELLYGVVEYGVGVDLWSAGCILAELLAGRPIMPGRNEIEQLHMINKLCGSYSEEYWRKMKIPSTHYKHAYYKSLPQHKRQIREIYKNFSPGALSLLDTLLALDPADRKTASDALKSDFFTKEPLPCEPSDLPKYPPTKEIDVKRRDEDYRRQRQASKVQGESGREIRPRERAPRAMAALEANAENQSNIDRMRLITKSKSEKFPAPHQDGSLGYSVGSLRRFSSNSFTSSYSNDNTDVVRSFVSHWNF